MSRLATLEIQYNANLTAAQAAHDEFVRLCESRPINLKFDASSPDRPTPSTFGGGAVGGGNALAAAIGPSRALQGLESSSAYENAARRLELAQASSDNRRVDLLRGYSSEAGDTARGINYESRAVE